MSRNILPIKCTGRSGGRDFLQSPLLQRQREAPRTRVSQRLFQLLANLDTLSYWKSPQPQAVSPVPRQDCHCCHREPGRVSDTGGERCIAEAERTYSCSSVVMTADLTAAVSH